MPDQCPYAWEFNVLIDYFVEKSIMSKVSAEDQMKWNWGAALGIDFESFFKIQKHTSLLIGELWDKLLGKWMVPKVEIFEDPNHEANEKKERKKKKTWKTYMPMKPVSWGSFSSILWRG